MKHTTVAIIGVGRVGATIAYTLLLKNIVSEILLIDLDKKTCDGEARDLSDALAFSKTTAVKQSSYAQARNADIIIIAAGKAQCPGQSRSELLDCNKHIITDIMNQLQPINSSALIIVVTNPVDIITRLAQLQSNLPLSQVFGSATWLDSQRLRRYLSQRLQIAPTAIDAVVLGEHGDAQFIPWTHAHVAGNPLKDYGLSTPELEAIAQNTRDEAYVIIEAKKATYYGVAACVVDICEAIIFNQHRVIPVSTYLPEYDVCISIPAVIGENGVEKHLPLNLTKEEQELFDLSVAQLKNM